MSHSSNNLVIKPGKLYRIYRDGSHPYAKRYIDFMFIQTLFTHESNHKFIFEVLRLDYPSELSEIWFDNQKERIEALYE